MLHPLVDNTTERIHLVLMAHVYVQLPPSQRQPRRRKRHSFLNFSDASPEPVLVKGSFFKVSNGAKMAFVLPVLPIPRASHHRIAPAGTERLAAVPLTLAVVTRRPVDRGAKSAVVHTRDRLQDDLRKTPHFLNFSYRYVVRPEPVLVS